MALKPDGVHFILCPKQGNKIEQDMTLAATAVVIWLYACVRYWLYRGVGMCASVLKLVLFMHFRIFYPKPRVRVSNPQRLTYTQILVE